MFRRSVAALTAAVALIVVSQTTAMAAHDPTLVYGSLEMVSSAETIYHNPVDQVEAIRGPINAISAQAELIRQDDAEDLGCPTSVTAANTKFGTETGWTRVYLTELNKLALQYDSTLPVVVPDDPRFETWARYENSSQTSFLLLCNRMIA